MRYFLVLALLSGCLWTASAAEKSSLTKRNNDARLRAPHFPARDFQRSRGPRQVPGRQDSKPENEHP
jgi:hypothetical protein